MNWIKPSGCSQAGLLNDLNRNTNSGNSCQIKSQAYVYKNIKGSSMIVEKNYFPFKKTYLSKSQLVQNSKLKKSLLKNTFNEHKINRSKIRKQISKPQLQNVADYRNFSSQISIHKEFQWKTDIASIRKNQINLPMKSINIRDVTKLKILQDEPLENFRKVKITMDYESTYFAIQCKPLRKQSSTVSLQYKWFSKIINLKLQSIGYEAYCPNKTGEQSQQPVSDYLSKIGSISGKILKKSQFLGKWQQRYVRIKQSGLYSFKYTLDPNILDLNSYTFSIKKSSVKYIWTRFQILNDFLIIKVKHGLQQTQFGIPITNYSVISGRNQNWLYAFYKLMMDKHLIMDSGSKISKQTAVSIQKQEDLIRS